MENITVEDIKFPSPCGEMVRKDLDEYNCHVDCNWLFPSPCGEMVRKGLHLILRQRFAASFHPLAGKWLGK